MCTLKRLEGRKERREEWAVSDRRGGMEEEEEEGHVKAFSRMGSRMEEGMTSGIPAPPESYGCCAVVATICNPPIGVAAVGLSCCVERMYDRGEFKVRGGWGEGGRGVTRE